jgi:hypothetical protein
LKGGEFPGKNVDFIIENRDHLIDVKAHGFEFVTDVKFELLAFV